MRTYRRFKPKSRVMRGRGQKPYQPKQTHKYKGGFLAKMKLMPRKLVSPKMLAAAILKMKMKRVPTDVIKLISSYL